MSSDETKRLEQQLRKVLESRDPAARGTLDKLFDKLWRAGRPQVRLGQEEVEQHAYERAYVSLLSQFDDAGLRRLLGEPSFASDIAHFGWRPLPWRREDSFAKWQGALVRFARKDQDQAIKRDEKYVTFDPEAAAHGRTGANEEEVRAVSAAAIAVIREEVDDRAVFVCLLREVEGIPWKQVASLVGHSEVHCRRLRRQCYERVAARIDNGALQCAMSALYESVLDGQPAMLRAWQGLILKRVRSNVSERGEQEVRALLAEALLPWRGGRPTKP